MLFWAREHRASINGTHRSNPRSSALERLQYLSRFVTSREKPYLHGSLERIIQESRMMRASRVLGGHTEVLLACLSRLSFVTTEYFGPIRRISNAGKSEKCMKFRQLSKRTTGAGKFMRIIYLFHLITSLPWLESWGTIFGIAPLANGFDSRARAMRIRRHVAGHTSHSRAMGAIT